MFPSVIEIKAMRKMPKRRKRINIFSRFSFAIPDLPKSIFIAPKIFLLYLFISFIVTYMQDCATRYKLLSVFSMEVTFRWHGLKKPVINQRGDRRGRRV